jgi:hypothetical protein
VPVFLSMGLLFGYEHYVRGLRSWWGGDLLN